MKTLYQKAYKRLLGKLLGSQEAVKGEVPATLSNYSHDILHRLPREDFKLSLKTPCFVKDPKAEIDAIQSFKRIREHAHIQEGKVCFKCEHRMTCPVAGKPPKQMTNTAVQDMLAFYAGLSGLDEASASPRIWNAAYKTSDSFSILLEDLKEGGVEFKQFDAERIKQSEERAKNEVKEKVTKGTSTKSKPIKEDSSEEEEEPRRPAKQVSNKPSRNESYEAPKRDDRNSRNDREVRSDRNDKFNRSDRGDRNDRSRDEGRGPKKDDWKGKQQFQNSDGRNSYKGRSENRENNFSKFNRDDPIAPRRSQRTYDQKGRNHTKFQDDQRNFEKSYSKYPNDRAANQNADPFKSESRQAGGFVRNDGPRSERPPRNESPSRGQFNQEESFSPKPAQRVNPNPRQEAESKKSVENLYTKFSAQAPQAEEPKTEQRGRRVRGSPRI